jgi:hypothetical protein
MLRSTLAKPERVSKHAHRRCSENFCPASALFCPTPAGGPYVEQGLQRHRMNPRAAKAVLRSASAFGSGTLGVVGIGLPTPGLILIENSSASGNVGSISNDGSAKAKAMSSEVPNAADALALKVTSRISLD